MRVRFSLGVPIPPHPRGDLYIREKRTERPRMTIFDISPRRECSLSRAAPKRGRERHERSEYSRWVYQSPRTRGGICTSARSGPSARKMTYTKKSAARGSLSRAAPKRRRERHVAASGRFPLFSDRSCNPNRNGENKLLPEISGVFVVASFRMGGSAIQTSGNSY